MKIQKMASPMSHGLKVVLTLKANKVVPSQNISPTNNRFQVSTDSDTKDLEHVFHSQTIQCRHDISKHRVNYFLIKICKSLLRL